jgi:serine-type D-Ala-D-Ala carboxypeptidase/endopeptidase (penicillin-binding protein 4)
MFTSYIKRLQCLILGIIIMQCTIPVAAGPSPFPALTSGIDQALADPILKHGTKGMLIKSLDTGKILYEKNSDVLFLPASCFKLLVSSASLDILGPDYRMQTSIYISGTLTPDGTLNGDVVLVGKGDPVFKYEHLQDMAAKVKELGIKAITGNVIGDDTWFDDVRLGWGWPWDEEPYYYSAQISALNLNENVVDVWVRPALKAGDPAIVKLTPPTGYMVVRNECKTAEAGAEKTVAVSRVRGRNVIRVSGTVPLDYKPTACEESITVEEPALFACQTLIEMLRREGIEVRGQPVRGTKSDDAEFILAHDSPPLSEIISLLNKPSDNLIAECLFKNLGAQVKGEGTAAAAEEVELDFLKRIGADISAVSISDGSGLSRTDYISPKNLVTVLRYMRDSKNYKAFAGSLPIAGIDGTLVNRMKGGAAEGKILAKTGYISRVSTIAGYTTTKSGEKLAFSIMMNGHLCRNKEATAVQDRILDMLAGLDTASTAAAR